MSRQVLLPEREIQYLESLDEARVGSYIFQHGTAKASEKFVALLRSFRIAAHVANTAWKLVQEIDQTGAISADALLALRASLANYAPRVWPPARSDLECATRVLEEIYDHLAQWASTEQSVSLVMLEQIFDRIVQLRSVLAPSAGVEPTS